ncbi:MAG: transketolase [Deltaproteobacteria bacterium]|nr:transketolase [Deltaproteobacteria bacterium]
MQIAKGFKEEELSAEEIRHLRNLSRLVRGDVLRMTQLAGGGHPGGSFSSVDLFVTLLASVNVSPELRDNPRRDRVVVSHGHTASAYYATLGRFDFFDLDDAVSLFRKAGSIFGGHVERTVPGVEWTTGCAGQGLAAGCGFALAARMKGLKPNVFVVMSDGEQQKGQVAEARRVAKKYRLNGITVLVDANNAQYAGRTSDILPQNVKYEYIADGWDVIEINGHDHNDVYKALRRAIQIQSAPVLVLAHTVAGHGVSFMENQTEYHSRCLSDEEYQEAMRELRIDADLAESADYRSAFDDFDLDVSEEATGHPVPEVGGPFSYGAGEKVENRSAVGRALADVADRNRGGDRCPIAVVDCGLAAAVRTVEFAQKNRGAFFQLGLQEHAAAVVAGAMSVEGVLTIWADYGAFGLSGAYDQLRMDDINRTHLKVFATHLGLDGGGDGRSHQCVDYLGLISSLFGVRAIFPADPNQADRAFRFMVQQPGNWVLGVGRSPLSVVLGDAGEPFFGGEYEFAYGRSDLVRRGEHGVILTTGEMLGRAVEAWDALRGEGLEPAVLHVACPKALEESEDPVLLQALRKGRVVTYEDHSVHSGLGAQVANYIARRGISCRLLKIGVERYGCSGAPDEVYRAMGLGVERLVERARKFLKR